MHPVSRTWLFGLAIVLGCASVTPPGDESGSWPARAADVTIVRDDWGVPHIYGRTDADAVFGMIYAQAEDDFHRIEVNFLNAMGRLAEAEGEDEVFRDLRMKLFIDPEAMKAQYAASPDWLRALMDAWAGGLNYFLTTNPQIKPMVFERFEPWMALTFSEGSIGGDIERVDLDDLEAFYTAASAREKVAVQAAAGAIALPEPTGSNGIAIAPRNTATGKTLLLINPHTSFYFRSELHMVSEEGLNAYGAVTWGQFFVYQGFNETAGWMHTSSGVDAIDEYAYEVDVREGGVFYRYGDGERRMEEKKITVPYRSADGTAAERTFTAYFSHHGPIVRRADDRWIAVKLMNNPMEALMQSYLRTKAASLDEFRQTMDRHTNSSNNTVFADAEGNIAYFHANFIPRRDPSFDWSRPVDGGDPATEWQEIHAVDDSPNVLNPPNGWVQNTNNWPFSAAGEHSPRQEEFPSYMDTWGENPRGVHALRLLEGRADWTLDGLVEAAYDTALPGFDPLIPKLVDAFESKPMDAGQRTRLAEPVAKLRTWDRRYGVESVATALAVTWGDTLLRSLADAARAARQQSYDYAIEKASADDLLQALEVAIDRLEDDFGDWRTPWGEINRFQRRTGDIVQPFDDESPSTPVGFTSGRWGALASFGTVQRDTKRRYGRSGNSFVAVVAFGDRLCARAITAGGTSGDPASPHFDDQIDRYASGDLRPVYFYRDDVDAHAARTYRPGYATASSPPSTRTGGGGGP